ncbi:One cut domain family member [Aphelenchoides fujianensis]|nr:One cut domain family member [Aphelenchoides fujianensis]
MGSEARAVRMETLDGCAYDPLLSAANGCIDAPLSPPPTSLLLPHPSGHFDCEGGGYYAAIATSGPFASLPPITSAMNAASALSPALTDAMAGGMHAFAQEDVGRYACVAHQLPAVSDAYGASGGMVAYSIKYEYDASHHPLLHLPPKTPHSPDDVAQHPQLPALLLAHPSVQQPAADEPVQYFDYSNQPPPPPHPAVGYNPSAYPTYSTIPPLQLKPDPAAYDFDCYSQEVHEENDHNQPPPVPPKCSPQPAESSTANGGAEVVDELNTRELAQRISAELKRYSIPQAIFAQRVLCRSQGTLSDLLRNPKPWSKLKSGRETFRRMHQWLQIPELKRMSELRLAACKRKEEQHQPPAHAAVHPAQAPTAAHAQPNKTSRQRLALFKNTQRPSRDLQLTIGRFLGLDATTVANYFSNMRRRRGGYSEEGTAEEEETTELDEKTADLLRLAQLEREAEKNAACVPGNEKAETVEEEKSHSTVLFTRHSTSPLSDAHSSNEVFRPPRSAPSFSSF